MSIDGKEVDITVKVGQRTKDDVHIIPSDPVGWEDGGVGARRGGCGWGTA